MKLILIILFALGISNCNFACINTYAENIKGEDVHGYFGLSHFYCEFDTLYAQVVIADYEKNKTTYDYKKTSDAAVAYTHIGNYVKALEIMQELHISNPNEYEIVANLGTIYELNGELDSAYKYMKESLKINPDAHHGSEWIHVKILEAKFKMKADSNWIYTNNVLNLNLKREKQETENKFPDDNFEEIQEVFMDINHQLEERIPYTPIPDPLIANIFKELGENYTNTLSIYDGLICYQIAMIYDPEDKLNIKRLYEELKPIVAANNSITKEPLEHYFPGPGKFDRLPRAYSRLFDEYEKANKMDPITGKPLKPIEGLKTPIILVSISAMAFALLFFFFHYKKSKR